MSRSGTNGLLAAAPDSERDCGRGGTVVDAVDGCCLRRARGARVVGEVRSSNPTAIWSHLRGPSMWASCCDGGQPLLGRQGSASASLHERANAPRG